ncbi:Sec14p-like phosphatidylinositol transfer family protein isoform 1 [Hibiscus syriacus]|uniref:Sec14p-like phosphatidylinositol transfer family protein isoform 1 n=1 Tax=Hibiscus syriacus TaxID=106335 RepID=A0A6A2W9E3_HIBSY|nr:bZIP transcription factor 44-like [Hibiscus syriacus]KAE8654332.1 Sec14p-like phosphatidylinositol transfer family protein isoform 1 [Hibiscus syriacus]
MASSSGTSSGSSTTTTVTQNSGSAEEDHLQAVIDERKRKRMVSNRESARRSRMRKQKHWDDLMTQATQLRKQNHDITSNINFTAQHLLNIEADNSVLRAQLNELGQRLESLNEIIGFLNDDDDHEPAVDSFLNPLNLAYLNQPIMASADNMFQY